MARIELHDFDADPLPSPFDGDLWARRQTTQAADEFLATEWRKNHVVQPERTWDVILSDALAHPAPEPKAYPYVELPDALKDTAHEFFYGDPEPEFERQHREQVGFAHWLRGWFAGFRRGA